MSDVVFFSGLFWGERGRLRPLFQPRAWGHQLARAHWFTSSAARGDQPAYWSGGGLARHAASFLLREDWVPNAYPRFLGEGS